jgi:16S rRNA (guanine(527)-N(7))-methyltransferase RsmG
MIKRRGAAKGELVQPRPEITPEELTHDFEAFQADMARQGVVLTAESLNALRRFGELVVERSRLLNLIGPADRIRVFSRHVAECLVAPLVEKARGAASLIDIGSGAGLPGIALALAVPDLRAILIEPRLRKSQFLEMAVSTLGLAGRVEVYQGTAESFALGVEGRVRAGLVTARAVGRLPVVWGWSLGLVRPGGWVAVFKGPDEVSPEPAIFGSSPPSKVEVCPVPGQPRSLMMLQVPTEPR